MKFHFYFFFSLILELSFQSCIPDGCALLCCSSDDFCSTETTDCVKSACSNSLCPFNCCVEGKCGARDECN